MKRKENGIITQVLRSRQGGSRSKEKSKVEFLRLVLFFFGHIFFYSNQQENQMTEKEHG